MKHRRRSGWHRSAGRHGTLHDGDGHVVNRTGPPICRSKLADEVDKIHDVEWDAEAKSVAIFDAAVSKGAFSGPGFVALHAKLQRLKVTPNSPPDFEDGTPDVVLRSIAAAIVLQRKRQLPGYFFPSSGYSKPHYYLRILSAALRVEARTMRRSSSTAMPEPSKGEEERRPLKADAAASNVGPGETKVGDPPPIPRPIAAVPPVTEITSRRASLAEIAKP